MVLFGHGLSFRGVLEILPGPIRIRLASAGIIDREVTGMRVEELVTRDSDILGGIPVFAGTRVPVKTLIDYLEKGHPLDVFLDDFPTVTRIQAQQVLVLLGEKLVEQIAA
jgi:uncharacterized protein (DUF433 family)